MTWWEAALLGLLQGLTEFLPVSSSGHLVLAQYILGIDVGVDGVTFEVFVHFGTVLSILTVYRRDVSKMILAVIEVIPRPSTATEAYRVDESFRTAMLILLTLIPTGIVYVLFRDMLEAAFGNPRLVCVMLIVTGVLLLLTLVRRHPNGDVNPLKALVIGLAQAAAMIPGISRSGSTICTAMYQNVEPVRAANFSFLMLLPVVLGATVIKAIDLLEAGATGSWFALLIGTVVAYVSGVAAIRLLLDVVRRGRLQWFAAYCFAAGAAGLLII